MKGALTAEFSEGDILFLVETADPRLLSKIDMIKGDPGIIEEGLRISKREMHVKSGMIDLYGFDKDHVPVVIEVKRSLANLSAVQQLRMYVNDVKKDVKSVEKSAKKSTKKKSSETKSKTKKKSEKKKKSDKK